MDSFPTNVRGDAHDDLRRAHGEPKERGSDPRARPTTALALARGSHANGQQRWQWRQMAPGRSDRRGPAHSRRGQPTCGPSRNAGGMVRWLRANPRPQADRKRADVDDFGARGGKVRVSEGDTRSQRVDDDDEFDFGDAPARGAGRAPGVAGMGGATGKVS